jgi:hypothetical protein
VTCSRRATRDAAIARYVKGHRHMRVKGVNGDGPRCAHPGPIHRREHGAGNTSAKSGRSEPTPVCNGVPHFSVGRATSSRFSPRHVSAQSHQLRLENRPAQPAAKSQLVADQIGDGQGTGILDGVIVPGKTPVTINTDVHHAITREASVVMRVCYSRTRSPSEEIPALTGCYVCTLELCENLTVGRRDCFGQQQRTGQVRTPACGNGHNCS